MKGNNPTYSVGILGLGNIGMLYDYDNNSNDVFLSHLKAFTYHQGFDQIMIIDTNPDKHQLAKTKYPDQNLLSFQNIEELNTIPDVLVLAADPKTNYSVFQKYKKSINTFLVEKPFLPSDYKLEDIRSFDDKVIINYPRKFIPEIQNLKKGIIEGKYGIPIQVHIWYSKGTRNNGSHLIDLCNYFFDSDFDINSIKVLGKTIDYTKEDPSWSFSINYNFNNTTVPVSFQAANEQNFSIIEMDILLSEGRLKLINFGGNIEISLVKDDPIFPAYKNLIFEENIKTQLSKYSLSVADYIYNYLNNNISNISSLNSEIDILKIVNKLNDEKQ